MNRIPSRRATVLAALLSCLLLPAVFLAQGTGPKALVVCPPTDAAGCDRIAAQLALATSGGSPVFPGGVDKKYTELRTMSLSQLQSYSAVFVPSLANAPYGLLRESAVRYRLGQVLRGRVAVWSGTPDRGTTDGASAGKLTLIQNLGRWAAAQHATDGSAGLVVLQDFSDPRPDGTSPRYDWIQGIAGVDVSPVTTVRTYSQVEKNSSNPATAAIVGSLAYDNMASFGLAAPGGPGLVGAWGQTTNGKKTSRGEVVLATFARTPPQSFTMTSAGGTITAQGGKVVLVFPAGAVPEPVSVAVSKATVSETGYVLETAYSFDPSMTFGAPVSLTISYLESNIPGGIANEPKLQMCVYKASAWSPVPGSTVNTAANTVTAPIDHFSRYAIFVEGCGSGGGGGGGSGKPVGSVTVTPSASNVSPSQSVPLTATVVDKSGNALAGRTVAWTTTGGSLSTASSTTDGTGKATTTLTAPATPGTVTVTAESGGKSGTATVTVNSGPAAKLVYVSGDGGSGAAGSSRTIEAKVTDANDNPVSGHTVSWAVTAGGGSVSAASSQTNSSGVASVTWTFAATAGTQTATASASGPGGALTGSPLTYTATALAGNAAKLAVSTQPSASAQAGVALATQPVVQIQDANGNPVSQSGVTVTAALGSGTGTLAGTTSATTDASGQASFTNLSICGTPGAYTLAFTAAPLTAAASNTITLSAGAASALAIHAGNSQSAPAGSAVATTPAVKVTDACGNPVSGVSVTFTVASGGGSVTGSPATTGSDGVAAVGSWTLGGTAGANTLDASATGLTTVTFAATGTAGAAATLAIHAGDGQTATVGTAVATAPAVRVTDSNGNPTAGVQVTFAASGNGSVTGSPATTDSNGVATLGSWTLATTAGSNSLTASASGLTSVQLTATGTAGAAASMTKTAGDGQSAPAGTAVPVNPQVTVADQYGNPVAGVSVTFTPSTGGAVTGSPATTAADGTAAVGSWTLASTTGPNSLTASAAGVTAVEFSATGTAGAPAKLALTTQPSSTVQAGVVFPQQPVVQVQDGNGIPVSHAGIEVTVQIASGGGTLGGTATATTSASGQATFSGLSIGGTVGSRTLSFSAPGMTGVTSDAISVTAGPAASLVFTTQPTTVAVNATITPAVQVSIADAYGNPVAGASDNVTLAIGTNPASGTLTGGGSAAPSGGVATFSGLSIDKVGAGYTLTASAGALTATSSSFDVTPGPVHHFVVEAAGGGPIGAQLVGTAFNVRVTAQDQYNNTATGFTGTVGFTSTPSGGISAGATSGAFTAGVLTSHGITFGTSGSFTLTATRTGGSEAGTSNSFEVQAPPSAVNDGPTASSAPGQAYHAFFSTSGGRQTFTLAATGVRSNDNLGFPAALITSFGADSLGGNVTTYAAGSTVAPLPGTGRTTGSLSVGEDGAITFTPPDGFTGNYAFRYRLTNVRGTSEGIVTIAVGTRPAAANDTYSPVLVGNVPINTAISTQFRITANDAGDAKLLAITGASGGTATLNADSTFTFRPTAGYNGPASFTYTVTNGFGTSAPATVSMTVGTPIWFVNSSAAAGGDGRYDAPFNSLATLAAINNGTGNNPAASDGIFLYSGSYAGPLTLLNGQRLIGQRATASLSSIAGVTWPADAGSEPAMNSASALDITAAGTNAVTLNGANGSNLLRGFNFGAVGAAGTALNGSSFGTLTISEVGINTNGRALALTGGTLSGSLTGVTSTAGVNNIALSSVGTSTPFSLGSGALSGATGAALLVSGGGGSFAYAGTITNGSGFAVQDQNRTGGTLSLTGQITAAGSGISVTNSTASLASTGTVEMTNTGNTISAALGQTALTVTNTTIGSGGLRFRSISANGNNTATNAVVLNNTGSTAGLTVAGTGSAGTGGTIQNTSGDAVSLTSTVNPSLAWMNVQNNKGSGIRASAVSGLSLGNSLVDNNGDTNGGSEAGILLVNLSGSNQITASTIRNSFEDNIRWTPSSGAQTLTLTNTTVGPNNPTSGNSGVNIIGTNTASATLNVVGGTYTQNKSFGIGTSFTDNSAHTVNVSGATFTDNNMAIGLATALNADVTFDIANNPSILRSRTNAIQVLAGATSTSASQIRGKIRNNVIGDNTTDSGARDGIGIGIEVNDDADAVVEVTGNNIKHTDQDGIFIQSRDPVTADADAATATVDLTVTGNTVGTPDDNTAFPFFSVYGVRIESRHNTTMCLDLSGNTSSSVGVEHFQLRQRNTTSVFKLERYAGSGTDDAAVANFVKAQNAYAGVTAAATHESATGFTGVANGTCRTVP